MDQWTEIANSQNISRHGEIVKLLKETHGLTHGFGSEGVTKNMTEELLDKFREEHDIKRVGPPLTYFKKW